MKHALIIVIILFGVSEFLQAQGFNSSNGRNHPELTWQVAETEHFLIMYPERISGIEDKAAAIAEESYRVLSANLEVKFNYKIRIYLSDEDEINNGFAVPYSRAHTNIWVHLNDYSEIWTGSEKWLRKVIAHELAHIFHFEAVKSEIGLLQYVFAEPFTSFWTEGLAQYQTEDWDSQRGDRWIRKAVFDDDLNFNSGAALENGRLKYALGNSQLRYFTEKYGDSTLVTLLNKRGKVFGLIPYHDFHEAFDEVVEGGYSAFFDDWRKHTNVYYNTLASQMERVDSLHSESFNFPGQFYFDAAVSPDDSLVAVLSLPSMKRPVKRLYVITNDSSRNTKMIAEGRINEDLSWGPEGRRLVYSLTVRGKHSSLLNDIFVYDLDTGNERQLTFSQKAKYPVFGPGSDEISYIKNEQGTGNIFTQNLKTGSIKRITNYSGDIQLLWLNWLPSRNSWLVHRFDEEGNRNLVLINQSTGDERVLDNGTIDNREPVVSPDGNKIAYISLRDEVPNVFIYDLENETESRFTQLFTGGEVFGWVSEFDTLAAPHLLIGASENRRKDQLHFVKADRVVSQREISRPEEYASWRLKTPPEFLDSKIEPNSAIITDRYPYSAIKNLTHVISFALPYYSNVNDWGLFATTNWTEPLGKHTISTGGWLSVPDLAGKSYGAFSYLNNQLYPSVVLSMYRTPENGQYYGEQFLIEEYTGGEILVKWPIDALSGSYQNGSFSTKFRHFTTRPFDRNSFTGDPNIPAPENARITNFEVGFTFKKQRPWANNAIHPLDGAGVQIKVSGSEQALGSDRSFLKGDVNTFTMFPLLGMNRLYLQARLQTQIGNPLPQNYIGFSHYDNININILEQIPLQLFGDNERVRGYREFVAGKQVAFGSMEYRMPFLPSLKTQILGIAQLGSTSLALFSDAGVVFDGLSASGESGTIKRWGAGIEIKNQITLFGISFGHSLGYAQPTLKLFGKEENEIYYRIKTVVPF